MLPRRKFLAGVFLACLVLSAGAAVTPEQVQTRIDELIEFIKSKQARNGSWSHMRRPGFTALNILALSTAGVGADDPAIAKACTYLQRNFPHTDTYGVGLYAAAFAAVDADRYRDEIVNAAKWLAKKQAGNGTWSYSGGRSGDNSVTQFAMLGLKAALDAGISVDQAILDRTANHFRRTQVAGGGWAYREKEGGMLATMIPAGLTSLHIAGVEENRSLEVENGPEFIGRYETERAIQSGLAAMAKNLNYRDSYLAYGIERVGIFYDRQFIGNAEWYPAGCAAILSRPMHARGGGPLGMLVPAGALGPNHAFNLLFLAKGNKPQLITKVRWANHKDWNLRYHDVRNITQDLSLRFQQKLDWQEASLGLEPGRLNRTPMLYIAGHHRFSLAEAERRNLYDFVESGGTVLFAANLLHADFIADVITELRAIYQGGHFADIPARHELRGMFHDLWGLDLPLRVWQDGCQKLRIFIFEQDVSLEYESRKPSQTSQHLLANLARYALREKPLIERLAVAEPLKRKEVQERRQFRHSSGAEEGAFTIAQLSYNGDYDIDPDAVNNELGFLRQALQLPTAPERALIDPAEDPLYPFPLLYVCGHEAFSFSATARRKLRQHLQRGGVLIANACCTSEAFDESFRSEMKLLFPKHELDRLPFTSPVYHEPFELRPEPNAELKRTGFDKRYLWGIRDQERYVVLYCQYDFSCAIDNLDEDTPAFKESFAHRLFTNLVSYSMTY